MSTRVTASSFDMVRKSGGKISLCSFDQMRAARLICFKLFGQVPVWLRLRLRASSGNATASAGATTPAITASQITVIGMLR